MVRFLADEKYREVIYDDDYRSYLMARCNSPGGYRFGRTQGNRVRLHARAALRRVNVSLKNMIEAIADTKLRRMERELELRGIRDHRLNDSRTVRTSRLTGR
jgi:hypothetical protein